MAAPFPAPRQRQSLRDSRNAHYEWTNQWRRARVERFQDQDSILLVELVAVKFALAQLANTLNPAAWVIMSSIIIVPKRSSLLLPAPL